MAEAARRAPCNPPALSSPVNRCPCGRGEQWPCTATRELWRADGKDPEAEARRVIAAILWGSLLSHRAA